MSIVQALFPEVKPEHKKPLTQKSGAFCIVKDRSRLEPAVATHMTSRKSIPINRRSPILAGRHESRPEGVLLSGAGLVITSPRFSFAREPTQSRFSGVTRPHFFPVRHEQPVSKLLRHMRRRIKSIVRSRGLRRGSIERVPLVTVKSPETELKRCAGLGTVALCATFEKFHETNPQPNE